MLTGVSIVCLVNHTNPVLRNVFGGASNNEGMGLLAWCFDWNLITSNCLFNPLWLQINQDIGIILTYILMTSVYYGNLWHGLDFPFMSQAIFVSSISSAIFGIGSDAIRLGCRRLPVQPDRSPHERQVRPCEIC